MRQQLDEHQAASPRSTTTYYHVNIRLGEKLAEGGPKCYSLLMILN